AFVEVIPRRAFRNKRVSFRDLEATERGLAGGRCRNDRRFADDGCRGLDDLFMPLVERIRGGRVKAQDPARASLRSDPNRQRASQRTMLAYGGIDVEARVRVE